MSIGQTREGGQGRFRLRRVLPSTECGYTFVELLMAVLILGVVLSALAVVLNIGDTTKSISSAKVDLQAHVRTAMDTLTRDLRETISWDIGNNIPSISHVKFRVVQGWDSVSDTLILSSDYIEYDYNATSQILTRSIVDASGNTQETREFTNITQPPFYTVDLTNSTVVPLNQGDLLSSRRVVVALAGQGQARIRGTFNVTCTLEEEVKIRNE